MAESELGRQLGTAVRDALAPAAGYLALVTQNNPHGSADELLRRPDTDAVLTDALEAARDAALGVVEQAWAQAGAEEAGVYWHLMSDITRMFDALTHLRGLVRHAHASVGQAWFVQGVTPPGSNPAAEAAAARAAAVRDILLTWSRQVALRSRMAVSMAEGAGAAHAVLADALLRETQGEVLKKRWRAHKTSPGCCFWCRKLDGVTIGLHESFGPHLGGPVAIPEARQRQVRTRAGERRFGSPKGSRIVQAHPPRLYYGQLQGPLLHPFCRCRLEIVRVGGTSHVPAGGTHGQAGHGLEPEGFVTAAAIRAIPETQFKAQRAFMAAAVHELDAVLRQMSGGRLG
jgi:hypothetical protein